MGVTVVDSSIAGLGGCLYNIHVHYVYNRWE